MRNPWQSPKRLLETYEGNRERAREHRKALVGNRCPKWLRPIEKPEPGQWPLYEFVPQGDGMTASLPTSTGRRGNGGPWRRFASVAIHFNTTGVPVLAKRTHKKPTQGGRPNLSASCFEIRPQWCLPAKKNLLMGGASS